MNLSSLAAVLFSLTTCGVTAAISAAVAGLGQTAAARWRNGGVAVAVLLAWLALTAVLAAMGRLSDFTALPPRVVPFILIGNLAAIVVAASALGKRLAHATPIGWLIGVQVFRVAVEVTLALLYHSGVVPVQMTFEGRNWDILVGLTALPVAWLAGHGRLPRPWLLGWNLLGLGLLANIVVISILSMPTPLRAFPEGPANTFIATAPYIWLPTVLVPTALGAHLLAFRHLLTR
jgi:hypothetical protein